MSITMSFIRVVFPFATYQILTALLTLSNAEEAPKKQTGCLCATRGYLVQAIVSDPSELNDLI